MQTFYLAACADNLAARIDTKSSAVHKMPQFALMKPYSTLIFQIKMRKPLRRAQPANCGTLSDIARKKLFFIDDVINFIRLHEDGRRTEDWCCIKKIRAD